MKMKILYKLIKYISITALVTLFLTVGQFGQFMRSSNDVRKHALEDWAGADQKRQEQVAEFTQACLVGKKSQERDFKKQWNSKKMVCLNYPLKSVQRKMTGHSCTRLSAKRIRFYRLLHGLCLCWRNHKIKVTSFNCNATLSQPCAGFLCAQ